MNAHPHPLRLIASRMAEALRPPPPLKPSVWAAKNLVLTDGERAGQTWDPATTPYLIQILDCLSPDHPSTMVTLRKSQQVGASVVAIAWVLYLVDRHPANIMIGLPGVDALRDFNAQKIQPAIDAWQRRMKVPDRPLAPATSKAGEGSSTFFKKNRRGGFVFLANANAAMDLSSKTIRYGVKDEVDKWTELSTGSDPHELFMGRFTVFRKSRNYKVFQLGTPEIAGESEIDAAFEAGDQRFYKVPCPQCGERVRLDFENYQFSEDYPHNTRHVNPCCGYPMSEAERIVAIDQAGAEGWEITRPEPGREPSFHIDAFSSKFLSMDDIVADFLKSRGSERKTKDFANLVRGRSYEIKGDAPDHVRLMERRSASWKRGHIPPRGLILVAAADVQMRGIWLEILAFGADRQSFVIDAQYLDGDTASPDGEVFTRLRQETVERSFPDAFGGKRRIDALGIDSGYRSHVVYSFVRRSQQMHPDTGRDLILALKGEDGWGRPAIGTPVPVDIDLDGRKIRQGAKLWAVGTWPLKGAFYADLRREGLASGQPADPEGYCHFGDWLDEVYFRQITSEYLAEKRLKGRVHRAWDIKPTEKDNHLLDCRVYNMALAEYLGLSTMTDDEWRLLALRRGVPSELTVTDLFQTASFAPKPPEKPAESAEKPENQARSGWIDRNRTSSWLNR